MPPSPLRKEVEKIAKMRSHWHGKGSLQAPSDHHRRLKLPKELQMPEGI
jgi:hypothetical protein